MTVQPIEAPAPVKAGTDNLRHVYCMAHGTPDHGLCGAPRNVTITKVGPLIKLPQNLCVVCHDLFLTPCTDCGD